MICIFASPVEFFFPICLMSLFDQAIKNAPGCLHPLVSRVLPFVGPIVNKVPLSKTLL